MPDARCPHCHRWAPRETWEAYPPGSFPFSITCPRCGIASDTSGVRVRVTTTSPPDSPTDELPQR